MSIISYSRFANFLKNKKKSTADDAFLPESAREKMHCADVSKPYNVNRDADGTRPWHSHSAKQNIHK